MTRRTSNSVPVLVVGVLGLVVNLVAFVLLREGAKESLNVQGAYLEVLSDALGSVGVIVAAIVWGVTGWTWVDPVIGAAIGVFILPRAWRLGARGAARPRAGRAGGLDVAAIHADLAAIPGSSTCTTCTCGRSRRRWTSPRPI